MTKTINNYIVRQKFLHNFQTKKNLFWVVKKKFFSYQLGWWQLCAYLKFQSDAFLMHCRLAVFFAIFTKLSELMWLEKEQISTAQIQNDIDYNAKMTIRIGG